MLCDRSGRARCGANWQLRLSPATSMIRSRSICQSMSSVAEAGEASRSRSSRRGCAWWRRAPIIAAPCVGPTRRCSSGETRRCVIGGARQRAHRRAAHPSRVVVGRSVAGVISGTRAGETCPCVCVQSTQIINGPNILVLYHQECKQSRCWVTNAARGGGAPSLP